MHGNGRSKLFRLLSLSRNSSHPAPSNKKGPQNRLLRPLSAVMHLNQDSGRTTFPRTAECTPPPVPGHGMNESGLDHCVRHMISLRQFRKKVKGVEVASRYLLIQISYGQSVLPKSAEKVERSVPSTSPSWSKSPSHPPWQSVRPKSAEKVDRSEPSTSPSKSKSPWQKRS